MLSGFEKIQKRWITGSDDEPSYGEPTDDLGQGMDIGGGFYAVCFGLRISHFVTDFGATGPSNYCP